MNQSDMFEFLMENHVTDHMMSHVILINEKLNCYQIAGMRKFLKKFQKLIFSAMNFTKWTHFLKKWTALFFNQNASV